MDIVLADAGLILWFVVLVFQLADLAASVVDIRSATLAGALVRVQRRFATTFWLLPLSIATGFGVVIGVEIATSMIFVDRRPFAGVLLLLGLVVIAIAAVIGIVAALSPQSVESYASVRAAATAMGTRRPTKKQVELLSLMLGEIDERKRDLRIGARDSRGQQRLRRDVDARVRGFRAAPPSGLSAIGSIQWSMAFRFLFGASWWRLVPVLVALVPSAATVLLGSGSIQVAVGPLSTLLVVPVLVSFLIAPLSAKASLAATATWHAVELSERAELGQLIANLERTSRRGVSGLGERVARALQILREQQG